MNKLTYFLGILFMISSCAPKKTYLNAREKELGTKGKNKWVFHQLSDRDQGTSLAFNGYIIGIEKAKRAKIGAPKKSELKNGNGLSAYEFNAKNKWERIPRSKRRILNDKKSMFISSIHKFEHREELIDHTEIEELYSACDTLALEDSKRAFQTGADKLREFESEFERKVAEVNPTHVFLYCMGWNSDQQEAIRNFNAMFLKIIDEANSSQKEFKPIFIGITWPSMWTEGYWNVLSFFNKSNDADEIGMTWGNHILNKVILDAEMKSDYKTVVVGHSFGAKLTSRATMSAGMLKDKIKKVDLLINLQSAYSINRYSKKKGVEHTEDYENWRQYAESIILVCSRHDKAVSKGFYAPMAGGIKAFKKVNANKNNAYDGINSVKIDINATTTFSKENELIIIDASEIINKAAHKKGGRAHSDIYNKELADLLWHLIEVKTFEDQVE